MNVRQTIYWLLIIEIIAEIVVFLLISAKQIAASVPDKLIFVGFTIAYKFLLKHFSLSITCF